MVSDLKLKPKLDESRIRDSWQEVMGKTTAKYTTNVWLTKGKLYVQVNSAPLKNELTYLRDTIKLRFNEMLGSEVVREVIIL